MLRATRLFLLALAALVLAACAAAPPTLSTSADRATTPFQQRLDAAGVPLDLPATGKLVLVNVPAFELVAIENGTPALRSRIIVGTARNPTPLLDTYTTAVRFRPSWRPTPEMVASGEYVDRVWPPGPSNPLGLAAIRLQPGLLVYLHDTNQRQLFERQNRALSHGCIRVQRWDELIAWLLDTDLAQVRAWANGPQTFDMPTSPVPVLIRYLPVFPAEDGTLLRHADIYRLAPADLVTSTSGAPAAGCRTD